jgi:hypothetical protein
MSACVKTRVPFVAAPSPEELTGAVNAVAEQVEAEGNGVKAVTYQADPGGGYSAMVVYGTGSVRVQRWGGGVVG